MNTGAPTRSHARHSEHSDLPTGTVRPARAERAGRSRTGQLAAAPPVTVALAVFAALLSLTGVIQPGRWLALAGLAVTAVVVVAGPARRRWRPVPAALAGIATGTLVAAAVTLLTIRGSGEPLLASLAELLDDASSAIADGKAPVVASPGLEVGLVLAAGLLTVVIEAVALGLRRSGIAALALAGVWSVTLVFERPPATPVLLLGCASLVLLLWAARPAGPVAPPATQAGTALGIAAGVAVLAMVLTPLAASLPGWAAAQLPARWGTSSGSGLLSLSTSLDLRSDLGNRPDRTVLTYRTDLAELGPLRTSTLQEFDGRRWEPSSSAALRPTGSVVLWPEETDAEPAELVDVQVTDLDQRTLPIPLDPRVVEAGPRWAYDQVNDTVRGQGTRTSGVAYRLLVAQRDLSPAALRADRPHETTSDSIEMQVVSSRAEQIAELATTVVGDARTTYDQAIALQSWFRDGSRFTYSVDVAPARSDDAVWDFLQDRRGYCVQFATAMTMMARSLDIPARVGVGFLPGERGTDDVWRVSARKAHAWPELWFADAGWVRFEPTPGVQTGAPPAYADPNLGPTAEPTEDIPTATATPRPSRSAVPLPSTTPETGQPDGLTSAPLIILAVALLALGAIAVTAGRRHTPITPERAWSRVRDATADRVSWSDATTPRQAAAMVQERWFTDAASSPESVAATLALSRVLHIVEAGRYSPIGEPWDASELQAWVDEIVAGISRADRAASPSAPRSAR